MAADRLGPVEPQAGLEAVVGQVKERLVEMQKAGTVRQLKSL